RRRAAPNSARRTVPGSRRPRGPRSRAASPARTMPRRAIETRPPPAGARTQPSLLLAVEQLLHFVQQRRDVAELAVHGGEANISDLVERAQTLNDRPADGASRDLRLSFLPEPTLDPVDYIIHGM